MQKSNRRKAYRVAKLRNLQEVKRKTVHMATSKVVVATYNFKKE